MRRLTLVVLSAAGLLACESTSAPVVVYERTVTPDMVTGAALAALRTDGRFTIPLPATSPDQVSLSEARSQTLQFARYVTNNALLRGVVEAGRGGYWTDPHLLVLCEDAYYVHSPVGDITDDLLGEPARSYVRRLGAQWVIPLCGPDDEPQMTAHVAVDGNDIRFTNGEPVEPYAYLGSAWSARGVPLNWPDALPISAERAARFAYETFGVRVADVPQAFVVADILADDGYAFQLGALRFCHRWRVVLESPVSIRGTTSFETVSTNVVHVGGLWCGVEPGIHLPRSVQPTETTVTYVDDSVSPPETRLITIPFSSPVRFEIGIRAP